MEADGCGFEAVSVSIGSSSSLTPSSGGSEVSIGSSVPGEARELQKLLCGKRWKMLKKLTVFILRSSGGTGNNDRGVGEAVLAGRNKVNRTPGNKQHRKSVLFMMLCNRTSCKTTEMGLTGTDSPGPVFPGLTDAADAGFGQELQ